MPTLISFLRGVNMTGHNSVRMADLSTLYEDLGFSDVVTYIQSGNVIFNSADDQAVSDIALKIERAILKRFNYNIPVMIRTVDELRSVLSHNPFLSEENFESSKMAAIFLQEKATEGQIKAVVNVDYPPDKFKVEGKEIFIYCPVGFGRTKLYTNFFEKKMGVTGTARNLKTIKAILQIASERPISD